MPSSTTSGVNGPFLRRTPVAWKTALAIAGIAPFIEISETDLEPKGPVSSYVGT